ncbi:MAG: substrate-binding domain-containing protein [Wujia sp.]
MKSKSRKIIAVMVSILCIVSGCSKTKDTGSSAERNVEGLDKLGAIQVVSREEGSGTRSTFADLVDFQSDGNDSSDLTTKDAVIENDADAVIKYVEENKSAIGYVSQGALSGNENIKALKIDGKSSDDGSKYPLSRDFYLAYSGKLNDLEQDFLSYVLGAGQEIVGENYEPVAKSSTFLSNRAKGEILIQGSTSVAPLMEELADAYEKINTNATITVVATDSTDGLTNAMAGECDFGMSSRKLKDYEKELLDYTAIARDNIVVIVGTDNPLDDILLDELRNIFTGEIKNWDELNQN